MLVTLVVGAVVIVLIVGLIASFVRWRRNHL